MDCNADKFPAVSGSGQLFARASPSTGLLKFLRWEVSNLGGATSLTFFIRGIARVGLAAAPLELAELTREEVQHPIRLRFYRRGMARTRS